MSDEVEGVRAERFADARPGIVVDEERAEDRLLRLEIVRGIRHAASASGSALPAWHGVRRRASRLALICPPATT
jgi:hypothetical protein